MLCLGSCGSWLDHCSHRQLDSLFPSAKRLFPGMRKERRAWVEPLIRTGNFLNFPARATFIGLREWLSKWISGLLSASFLHMGKWEVMCFYATFEKQWKGDKYLQLFWAKSASQHLLETVYRVLQLSSATLLKQAFGRSYRLRPARKPGFQCQLCHSSLGWPWITHPP